MSDPEDSDRPAGDHEVFVTLMQVAGENPEIRRNLLQLLNLAPQDRKTFLYRFVRELYEKEAPREFIEALAILTDDEIAEKALSYLEDR